MHAGDFQRRLLLLLFQLIMISGIKCRVEVYNESIDYFRVV
jgi:hypothetical protein